MGKSELHRIAAPAALAAALAAAVGGCATDFHYSEVVGFRYFKTNIDTFPVSINTVDGRDYIGRAPVLIDPGVRTIVVQGPPTAANWTVCVSLVLAAKPCTRYYLVAVKQSPLEAEFTVKIDYEEPIAGCTPPPAAK